MWYPVKLLHISYNLFAGTEMLSLRVRANRNTNFAWGDRPPIWGGRGGVRGSNVVPRESPSQLALFVYLNRYAISLSLGAIRLVSFGVGVSTPKLWGRDLARGSKMVPFESLMWVSY